MFGLFEMLNCLSDNFDFGAIKSKSLLKIILNFVYGWFLKIDSKLKD